tara:strand:+ start:188 stop:703 length:516 start_codon:yes stop_codon:yes gene_type:complete
VNSIAKATQYPVRCPECGKMTAFSAAKLLQTREVTCRHCATSIPLDSRTTRLIERTLRDMDGYVEKKDSDESPASEHTEQPIDIPDTLTAPHQDEQTPPPATKPAAEAPASTPQHETTEPQNQSAPDSPHSETQVQHTTNRNNGNNANRRTPSKRSRRSKRKNRRPSVANG